MRIFPIAPSTAAGRALRCAALALVVVLAPAAPVSATSALAAADLGPILHGIDRDLGALRAQLEVVRSELAGSRAWPGEAATVAYAVDLGDGGEIFRLRALETMVRSLGRQVERLGDRLEGRGAVPGRETALLMSLEVHNVHWAVEELRFARGREDADLAVDRLERLLADLGLALDGLSRAAAGS
jgi:hypothetical protein